MPAEAALRLTGPATLQEFATLERRLSGLAPGAEVDLSGVTRLDVAGAWRLITSGARLTGAAAAQALMLQTVTAALPAPTPAKPHPHGVTEALARLGRAVSAQVGTTLGSLDFLGDVIWHLLRAVASPRRLRRTALVHHMEDAGLNALPIVALMGFLIGVVLAFQGAAQLTQFGAEVFVVDLIAFSILRELGVLLTAIIVAGRSASAFTAALGSMKMRQEIDAMRVLGLDPVDLLVLPRMLALVIWLPILAFVADMAGLVGGALMAWADLGISPGLFRTQLLADTGVAQLLVGLSKAPVFALIIAVVGCHQGMQVGGDAESLGRRTSRSVVVAIFLVIVTDALFSIFFALWGV